MEIFLRSISGILVILGMILVGFVIGEKGWFDDKSRGLIAKLVTQIALPCYMLYTITQRFTAADLLKMLPELRFPALSMVILLGIATAVARIFAVRQDRRGLFISMFFNSNRPRSKENFHPAHHLIRMGIALVLTILLALL